MEYHEAIEYLEGLRHFRPKLGTGTTEDLLDHLGAPGPDLAVVQVAGSNGKGSTARMLESVLREAGRSVGLYTSPDLADVRERVRVDGRKVARSTLAGLVEEVRPHVIERTLAGEGPTFFEVLTALAIAHFDRRDVDVAVLEVGIGGRYDATSAVDPVAAAVTSVSLEHTDILGETVAEIARDKAHVAPEGRPLVTGATGDALDAIREAADVVTVGGEDADVRAVEERAISHSASTVAIDGEGLAVDATIPLIGEHQARNAGIAAVLARQVADVDDATVAAGLGKATWPGRFEVMGTEPLVVLDGAHNPAACAVLAGLLERTDHDDLHLVFGAMRDKDLRGMADALPEAASVTVCRPDVGRAETTEALSALFADRAPDVAAADSVLAGVERGLARADPGDCVLVTGSLFTVAEARDRWTSVPRRRDPATVGEARAVLTGADVPAATAERRADRAVHRTVTLSVRPAHAETLLAEMGTVGGSAFRAGAASPDGRTGLVLAGTVEQFDRLAGILADGSRGLAHLAGRLRAEVERPVGPADAALPWDERPAVMGVLNVTPDSFHDGGAYLAAEDAIARAEVLVEEGAAIVDVGGESTRPGADPVPPEAEIERVRPVVEAVADLDATVSIDTRKAPVAEAAIEAGADLVNDVTGLEDPAMRRVVADHDVPVVLMHSLGAPVDPERRAAATYDDVVEAVVEDLAERILVAERDGVDRRRIIVDPGVGFGKGAADSFELLDRLDELGALGCPVMVGHSRKSMFAEIDSDPGERLPPTIALTAMATERGADVIRVHDVAENVAAVRAARGATGWR